MTTSRLALLAPMIAIGCSSATAPTPAAVKPAIHAIAYSMLVAPDAEVGKGWRSPTSVSLTSASLVPSATIEAALFRMFDDRGEILAEASISLAQPMPADGYLDGATIVQTLAWSAERGYAKRLDMILTVRNAAGEVGTVSLSIPAK